MSAWPVPRHRELLDINETVQSEPDLPDFSDTISADIESTRRQFIKLNLEQGGTRAERELERMRQAIFDAQTEEIKELRSQVALLTSTMKTKASKTKLSELATALTEKTDKRLDTIRNLVLAAVTIIGLFLGWVSKMKGS